MSRRERTLIAFASALQPKSLDLTRFAKARTGGREELRRSVTMEDAAAALGFASSDWWSARTGKSGEGNPLAAALLRMKYADGMDKDTFTRAHWLLLDRHVAADAKRPISETLYAVSLGALTEWLYDACPKCRGPKADAHGMVCRTCGNSGRRARSAKQRWHFVANYLRDARGPRAPDYGVFLKYWLRVHEDFLRALRETDQGMVESLDTQVSRNENAGIGQAPLMVEQPADLGQGAQQEEQMLPAERAVARGERVPSRKKNS